MQNVLNRRQFLSAAIGGAMAAAAGTAARAQQQTERPNVLFIPVDDLRPQLGCYGETHMKTPRIDAFAETATLFERAYCQEGVCNPSRTSLLTGLRPDTSGVTDNLLHFRDTVPDVVTLPQHFKQNGYESVGIGKIYHSLSGPWDEQSWSRWLRHGAATQYADPANRARELALQEEAKAQGLEGRQASRFRYIQPTESYDAPDNAYPDGMIAEQAIAELERLADQETPFFFAVGFLKPHLPFTCPRRYWDLYDPRELPMLPADLPLEGIPEPALHPSYEVRFYDWVPDRTPFPRDLERRLLHGYYACTSFVDAQVGKLLDTLEGLGLAENTIVVLWGDHGWHLGDHEMWGKDTNFEYSTRSPLIIRMPGQEPGRAKGMVEFVDVYPTLCELAGLPKPEHLQGLSLAPLLEDPAAPFKDAVFSQINRSHKLMGYSMRTERWRYNEWRTPEGEVTAVELYDHETDPRERRNVAGDPAYAETVQKLAKELDNAVQSWRREE